MTPTPATATPRLALIAAGVSVVLWASAFVGIRDVADTFSPGAIALGRLFVGSLALGVPLLTRGWVHVGRRDFGFIVAAGLLWFGAYNLALNEAERHVDAGTASMLVNTGPIFLGIFAGVFLREGLPARLLIGLAVAFAGSVVVGFALPSDAAGSNNSIIGIALCIASAIVYAAGVTLEKPVLKTVPALQLTWMACTVGFVACLPFTPELLAQASTAPLGKLGWLAYLGIFPTAIGFTTWAYALNRTNTGRLGVTTYLVPPVVILMAWLLLGEVPPVLAIVGGVICIAGVVVVRTPSLGRLRASAVVSLVLALGIGACGGGTVSPGPTVAPSASSAALAPTNPPATVPPIPTLPPVGSLPIGRIVFDRVQGTAEGDFQGAFILGPEGTEAPIDAQPGAEFLIAIWSPDGRTMLVDTYLPAGPQVDTLDIASGRYTPLHAGGLHGALECTDWSPDGKTVICFLGNDAEPAVEGIYAVTVADGSAVRLTASPFHHVVGASGECGGGEGRAVYSADGKRFAFEQQRCGTGPDPSSDEAGNIVVANADGSGQTEIVAFGGVRTHAGGELSWSPADDVIAFGTQDGALSTIRADGTGLQTISLPVSGFAYGPSWSPDGKWILVTIRSGRTGQTELYAVMPDGSSAVRLTDNALIEAFTDWGPAKP